MTYTTPNTVSTCDLTEIAMLMQKGFKLIRTYTKHNNNREVYHVFDLKEVDQDELFDEFYSKDMALPVLKFMSLRELAHRRVNRWKEMHPKGGCTTTDLTN